jgi:hypothetical protein
MAKGRTNHMSRRISTKAAESGQTTGGPADDAIAPPVSSATAAEEHHTVVDPEIIEPEILPKQASGKKGVARFISGWPEGSGRLAGFPDHHIDDSESGREYCHAGEGFP